MARSLVLDIGNSCVKMAVMEGDETLYTQTMNNIDLLAIARLRDEYCFCDSILSTTRSVESLDIDGVRSVVGELMLFDAESDVPIVNSYATPATLGRDRLAAAVGAQALSDKRAQLVIDMGTAITIDLVTKSGGFEGGVISPGVSMRFRALGEFTARLPHLVADGEILSSEGVARSTEEALQRGVLEGVLYELEGHIAKIMEKNDEIDVIFVGGEAKYFEKRIKNAIFAKRDVLFVGLNRILEHNRVKNSNEG